MVKPCTSDQARAISAACPSDSACSEICSWRLAPIAPASPANEALAASQQRGPRHVETLGAEHQPVHAGMRLGVGDIGPGPRHRLLQRRRGRGAGGRHRGVELAKADRGEFADEPGEVAEMMRRRGMRHPRLARHRAQRQAGKPVAFEHPLGGLKQRIAQRAVMIGRVLAGRGGGPGRATLSLSPRRRGRFRSAGGAGPRWCRFSCHLQFYRSRF